MHYVQVPLYSHLETKHHILQHFAKLEILTRKGRIIGHNTCQCIDPVLAEIQVLGKITISSFLNGMHWPSLTQVPRDCRRIGTRTSSQSRSASKTAKLKIENISLSRNESA